MKYNPHIHNRRSMRLKGYDYSKEGAYFITICCKDRACLFGKIINGEMILNDNGKIAYNEWLKTTEIRPNVELDVFVIMPNHIHGIISINNREIDHRGVLHTFGFLNASVPNLGVFNTPQRSDELNTFRSPSQTIGAILRGYKSSVKKQINILGLDNYKQSATVWQRNFHDHIIRNEKEYQTISNYIVNNPGSWNEDRFYKE